MSDYDNQRDIDVEGQRAALFYQSPPRACAKCGQSIIDDLSEWTDGAGLYWHGACRPLGSGAVTVPREVLEFFEFCDHVFVPFTGQQEELMISLRKARVAMGRPEYASWERKPR